MSSKNGQQTQPEDPPDPAPPVQTQPSAQTPAQPDGAASTVEPRKHPPATPPFPDVDDPRLGISDHTWDNPVDMVKDIENHVMHSHGLEPDRQKLRQIAAFLRKMFDIPPDA